MEDVMTGIFLGAIPVIIALMFAVPYFRKGKYSNDEHQFEQAGVRVSYKSGKFFIKKKSFDVSKVSKIRTSSGDGKRGNQSWVWIDIDDMDYPVHEIGFIQPNDAQKFAMRFSKAIEKAGGPSLS